MIELLGVVHTGAWNSVNIKQRIDPAGASCHCLNRVLDLLRWKRRRRDRRKLRRKEPHRCRCPRLTPPKENLFLHHSLSFKLLDL
jgi:hypothetical protein